jgi:hypothetical protein
MTSVRTTQKKSLLFCFFTLPIFFSLSSPWHLTGWSPSLEGSTVTVGIVSAVDRSGLTPDGETLYSLIQTDAVINRGNSRSPASICRVM